MSFLTLCQDVRRECGISGTGPASVLNQSGELLRVVNWTAQAWTEIQNKKPNWRWMRSQFTVNTSANVDTYAYGSCTDTNSSAVITRFKRWWDQEFQIYLASAGSTTSHFMTFEPWSIFRHTWKVGAISASYPSTVTITPQNSFMLGAKPNDIYTVTGEYQKSAQVLAADADVPEMPSDFHQLIVYRAMRKYAGYAGAPEVWARVKQEAGEMWADLMLDQLDQFGFGDPLA